MSSINSVRIPGLATGIDTDQMVKDMLTADQERVDKVSQNQQISKWKQETYREIIKDMKSLYDKYFSSTSKDYILSSKAFNTLTINSSNSSVITASANSGASNINYNFEVNKLAQSPQMINDKATNGIIINKDSKLRDLGLNKETSFKVSIGNDNNSKVITIEEDDTIQDLINKVNGSMNGEIKMLFSDMTGKLTLTSNLTGESSVLKIIDVEKDSSGEFIDLGTSNSLSFLGFDNEVKGSNAYVIVKDSSGNIIKSLNEEKNTFNIDGITYTLNGIGSSSLNSSQDTSKVVDKMQNFINDYNKIVEKVYNSVTERKNRDYLPLTDSQREEMTEDQVKKWEEKAKSGILRNDSELRMFMNDIRQAMFSPLEEMGIRLSDIGINSAKDYNKQGQIELNVDQFTKYLQENGELTQKAISGVFNKVKDVIYKYAGSSNGVLVKKAGIERTSTDINNIFSNQIKRQEEQMKSLIDKMKKKEQQLYSKFARLEAMMSKLNSQMSFLSQ